MLFTGVLCEDWRYMYSGARVFLNIFGLGRLCGNWGVYVKIWVFMWELGCLCGNWGA
jgi:hypothetical protein